MKIAGKVVVITGASSGLGLATVQDFITKGAKILAMDLNQAAGDKLEQQYAPNLVFAAANVCDEKAVQAGLDKGVKTFGRLDILVNCAGTGRPRRVVSGKGDVHSMKDFEFVIKVNVFGTFNVTRLFAGQIFKQIQATGKTVAELGEQGVVINTASVAAFDGQIGQASYSASKAAIAGMTLPLARDLASVGIRVVTVAPGIFETPMLAALPEKARKSLMKQVPFPSRLGKPEEFAHICAWIIDNEYINGETIRLDGSIRMAAM